ncbi:NADH-dependent flavin oxidoreductase [Pectobacterium odoriferum]|uniref:NADH:flavin oxidoreductase n=1 Tax=Pectobacterium odoriferum TaxID=78398 RepID=A0ABR4VSV0_9GAMM|nr:MULTISPECIES: NADH-dependent flavin oxidoreductase [Pectobacterium]KGA34594.1 NADH:flavin oxidoreductase [Pectobacterium odoriferum]KGA42452.1 NADH:flavin oxidoreductase [Pectobacterium odoriferum]MDE8754500.1 NADH-dependent flavin oxidoreductase [Pectobacterium polaris]
MNQSPSNLFETLELAPGITSRNRVVMSPMTTWAGTEDFQIAPEEEAYYRLRVKGVGLVITGCAQVTANGIGFTHEFSAADDSFIPSLRRLADAAKSGGAPAFLQLFHAGNKALPDLIPGGDVVSASAIPTVATPFVAALTPRALSGDEVVEMIKAFGEATKRGIEAGFDGVELHGAHGFLLQNFLSPATNTRTDEWGGSLENRMRFPLAVVAEVKRVIAKHADRPFALGIRLSPEEPGNAGYRIEQTLTFIDRLLERGVDYIHASLATLLTDQPIGNTDGQSLISRILGRVGGRVPVIGAGGLLTPEQAKKALATGLSGVAIGRGLIINPDWVSVAQEGREVETALDPAQVTALEIPPKLWAIIQSLQGWFPMKSQSA